MKVKKNPVVCDVLVVGAGVVGFSVAIGILEHNPTARVIVADKESNIGIHASGRNSGVLHAGFYYSPESLKAKFCREGNLQLRRIIHKYSIPIREVGKIVVSKNEEEDLALESLWERGHSNGVDIEILDRSELSRIEPLAVTNSQFLWSPTTAVSNPSQVLISLRKEFESMGGKVSLNQRVSLSERGGEIYDDSNQFSFQRVVNAAGAQADRISRAVNVGSEYAMLPFMGTYRATNEKNLPIRHLIYPVPHVENPFLGVHFTLTIDGQVKLGPTAIPVLAREQYSLWSGYSASDFIQATKGSIALLAGGKVNLSSIVKSEWPKLSLRRMIRESSSLVPSVTTVSSWEKKPPGIRAQLVHLPTGRLEQDFVVKSHLNSIHILNAVSPGWTSALPFGNWIVSNFINKF